MNRESSGGNELKQRKEERGQRRHPRKDMQNSGMNATLEKVMAKNYLDLSRLSFKKHYKPRLIFYSAFISFEGLDNPT